MAHRWYERHTAESNCLDLLFVFHNLCTMQLCNDTDLWPSHDHTVFCATIQTGLYITADLTVHDHRCARNGPLADILATGGRGAVYVKNPKWFKAAASIAQHPKDTALTTALTTFRARPLLPSVGCEILGHAYGYAGIKLEPIGSTA